MYTKIPPDTLNENEIVQELAQKHKVTVSQVIEEVCRFKLNKRLTVFMFKKALLMIRVMNEDLPTKLINYLYRVIDINNKGSIYFTELFHFCLQNSSDMSIMYIHDSNVDSVYLENILHLKIYQHRSFGSNMA